MAKSGVINFMFTVVENNKLSDEGITKLVRWYIKSYVGVSPKKLTILSSEEISYGDLVVSFKYNNYTEVYKVLLHKSLGKWFVDTIF